MLATGVGGSQIRQPQRGDLLFSNVIMSGSAPDGGVSRYSVASCRGGAVVFMPLRRIQEAYTLSCCRSSGHVSTD